jgi:hypothetical protein
MGLVLVQCAFFHAQREGIGHAATRLLVHMAATAYDPDNKQGVEPLLYFASRSTMAHALGLEVPDRKPGVRATKAERDLWTAGNSRVKRALAELLTAGALEQISVGIPGWHACFKVTVSAVALELLEPLTGPHMGPLTGPHGDRSPVQPETAHRSPKQDQPDLTKTGTENHYPAPAHLQPVDGFRFRFEGVAA